MATTIKVETDKIESTKNQIANLKVEYEGAVEKIYQLDDEINSTWIGTDSNKFSEQLEDFHNDFKDLNDKFQNYIDFLQKAKIQYDKAQEDITQKASQLAVDR